MTLSGWEIYYWHNVFSDTLLCVNLAVKFCNYYNCAWLWLTLCCLIDSLIDIMSDKTTVWLTGGFYCPGSAVVTPDLPCSAGYYCKQGAKTATPVQGQYADPCPVGHYCPEQTAEPIQCPVGTFSNNIKLRNVTDCLQCTRGECCLVVHPSVICLMDLCVHCLSIYLSIRLSICQKF